MFFPFEDDGFDGALGNHQRFGHFFYNPTPTPNVNIHFVYLLEIQLNSNPTEKFIRAFAEAENTMRITISNQC